MTSWANDRLPELIWAALLVTRLERHQALALFRQIADYCSTIGPSGPGFGITHSAMATLGGSILEGLLRVICVDPASRQALMPLTILPDLPARDYWITALGQTTPRIADDEELWNKLGLAVARTLFHQSQEATDCRWIRVLAAAAAGRLHFVRDTETAKEIFGYPDYGDIRKVRPTIRAAEGALDSLDPRNPTAKSHWSSAFWQHCLRDTQCKSPQADQDFNPAQVGPSVVRVRAVYEGLVDHCSETRTTTDIDAKHDTVFGIALYSLSFLDELYRPGVSNSGLGRSALRTMVELLVTLKYLVSVDTPDMWKVFRNYGLGQAKLALLKLSSSEIEPGYVDLDALEEMANEDAWMEFVPINLGNWGKMNLRTMSIRGDCKEIYDQYYDWTSAFVHGHWGAVRDVVFQFCLNPLHRLHRIPRGYPRQQEDVIQDACMILDHIMEEIDRVYPPFQLRLLS